jgi:hypothetical protein
MPDQGDFGLSELHETIRGGERVLIRQVRPEDMALYPDFLGDVSAEDLRLRFFAHIAELSAAEIDKLAHLDYRHEMAFIALDEDTGRMLGLVRLKDELDERLRNSRSWYARGSRSRTRLAADAARHRLRQGERSAARVAMCWSKHYHAANVSSSVSTRWTWDRTSGALCSISRISAAVSVAFGVLEKLRSRR